MISLTKRLCQSSISSRLGALQVHTNAEIVANSSFVRNRNPRNLELMRIARKPAGFRLEKPGREFWHKYEIICPTITSVALLFTTLISLLSINTKHRTTLLNKQEIFSLP